MRVVLDTNVIISASLKPEGNEARVIRLAHHGWYRLAVCPELAAEYREVSQRKKFAKYAEAMQTVVDDVLRRAERVLLGSRPCLCRDPDDDMVLACFHTAGARFLITGNLADFPADPGIVNARQFLDQWVSAAQARG